MSQKPRILRNFTAGEDLDAFLVSAIGAVLVIRSYLHLMDYPQIGGGSLHIAHMLWGGLLMLAAIVVLLAFLGRNSTRIAAILGGLGFGTFIDEVGKFVTADNDYFFEPAVAIMYAVFAAVYIVGRLLQGGGHYRREEYFANALREMQEVAANDLDEDERERALDHLSHCDPDDAVVSALRQSLSSAGSVRTPRTSRVARFRAWLHASYLRIADLPGFALALILFFSAQMVTKLGYLALLIFRPDLLADGPLSGLTMDELGFADWAELSVSVVAALFVLAGVLRIRSSRLDAYRMFRASIFVSLFFTEIFVFAKEQFSALFGFAFDLLVLIALNHFIGEEKRRRSGADGGERS